MAPKSNYTKSTTTVANTDNCSRYANCALPKEYRVKGDAWSRDGDTLYNGYDDLTVDSTNPMDYHIAAQQNLYKNFKTDTLDKNKTYMVNMYYQGSPYMKEAFDDIDGNGIKGTHTGNLYWDSDTQSWRVEHNIHGVVHNDDWISLQQPGRYGVTAIQKPRKNNLFYRLYDWVKSNKQGGTLNYLEYTR